MSVVLDWRHTGHSIHISDNLVFLLFGICFWLVLVLLQSRIALTLTSVSRPTRGAREACLLLSS